MKFVAREAASLGAQQWLASAFELPIPQYDAEYNVSPDGKIALYVSDF